MPPRFEPPAPPLPPPPPPPPTRPARAHAILEHLAARASFAGDLGSLPTLDAGGELAVSGIWRGVRVEVESSLFAPSSAGTSDTPNEGAHVWLLTVGARVGYELGLGRFALEPRVGLELDREVANGFGGQADSTQTGVWVAPSLGALGSVRVNRLLRVTLGLDAVIPTTRPSFLASEPAPAAPLTLHHVSAVSGRTSLGVECRFR